MNAPTIIVLSIVAAVFVAIVAREIIKKKKGESSCSCGCGGCAFKDSCHSNKSK
ncbi:MAG: FeoB-associated Cys-rich membrane protein [Clostridia bacterium]|nr:FeoB-associated Cys-rich membrane protein [Clostridia bacterium]MBR3865887.1 FeoB-associated Cys-rich membrane protein [Clostridia bacterium]